MSATDKCDSDTLSDVASFCEGVAVACKRETELKTSALTASNQRARASVGLLRVYDIILKCSKELAKIVQLKTATKDEEDSVAFYEAKGEDLEG